jgi:tetratricopeptide (TPR) repeat protein
VLTPWLIDNVRNGDAILFLGAGAVRGALGPKGEKPLSGLELRDLIADKFLGGQHKDKPLARVAEYAKNESSLPDVQTFIRNLFLPLQPPSFYQIIPSFRWFAIVTTNYDLTLERAYDGCATRLQILQPILRNGDRLSSVLRDDTALPFLKLHGCITAITDPTLPLILATEEYAKHKRNRDRLFGNFADWAKERPIIFAGYDISDPNILQILFDLADQGLNRPIYAVVDPGLDAITSRYWSAKRFVPVPSTFEFFLQELDRSIPQPTRILAALRSPNPVSFQRWVTTHVAPSDRLRMYLSSELTHVHPNIPVAGSEPKRFYAGEPVGWSAIAAGLNVRRRVCDDIILDSVLSPPKDKNPRIFLLKGHAGAGISVALRQVAWEAARDFDGLVFYLNEGALVRPDLIIEIMQLTRGQVLLVVDDAISHLEGVQQLARTAKLNNLSLDILLGTRTNEWNVAGGEADALDHEAYELRDLTDSEIRELLERLKTHGSLNELEKITVDQQIERFKHYSGRQLLVALHEATTGKPFEELSFDEYDHISPLRAKVLYLDICTLHRLNVPVRAGLISRVSGVTFAEFNRDLFKPLEHVVFTYQDHNSRDYAYRTRHPVIAEFVFRQALPDPVERAAQIKRIIRHMNIDYESDSVAFGMLIKGKTLADLFADKALAKEIFDSAAEGGAPISFINHQRAVFELNHPGGDMRAALAALATAEAAANGDKRSIEHTKAQVLRRLALDTVHAIERDKLRMEARKIYSRLQRSSRTPHAVTGLAQLDLDELNDLLSCPISDSVAASDLDQRALTELIRQIEQTIYSGLQSFPGDEFLLNLESRLSEMLDDHPGARKSLQKAFDANPARAFIAVRLARTIEKSGDRPQATSILERCLTANPGSKECHLALAMLQMKTGESISPETIGYHLKRSFTEGDSNFSAQFWWARHEFLYGNPDNAISMFAALRDSRISAQIKRRLAGPITDHEGTIIRFTGAIASLQPAYCFVHCDDLKANIFVPARSFSDADWAKAHAGSRVSISVSFSMQGPQGVEPQML